MKSFFIKLTLLILLLISSWTTIRAQTNEYYYYYKDKRVKIFVDSTSLGILTKDSNLCRQIDSKNYFSIKTANQKYFYCKIDTINNQTYRKIKETLIGDTKIIPCFKTQKNIEVGLTNRFYVKLKSDLDTNLLFWYAKENNIEIVERIPYMEDWFILSCPINNFKNAIEYANQFFESGLFVTAEPEFVYKNLLASNDIYYSNQWGLHNNGQYGDSIGIDINVEPAWKIVKGQNIKVAVFDQGFEMNHPDLINNVYGNGYDAETGISASQVWGKHGTACAGIIGAEENNIGIIGVAPKSQIVSISLALGFFNTPEQIARGFGWARENNIDIISNSWGGFDTSYIIESAINQALNEGRNGNGCIVVFASGNENDTNIRYPGCAIPDILVVGAVSPCGERKNPNSCDEENWGSCYGRTLDVVAPGVLISTTDGQNNNGYNPNIPIHTLEGGNIISSDYPNKDYTIWFDGTSSACPHVAGVAALVLSANPNLTGQQVCDIIESTAQKVGAYSYQPVVNRPNGIWNNEMGYGLVDAYAAVVEACLYGNQIIGDTNVETCQISSFDYEGYLPDSFQIYWKISPNCTIYSGQNSTHVEIIPISGDTATLYAYIILNEDTLKVFSKKLSITDYNTNIVTPNLSNGIPLDSVWNTDYTLITPVTIPTGKKLTINANVSCMPNVKITVENGGRLVINNAEISSYCDNTLWKGIEVWGTPDASQYSVNRNTTTPQQGEVVLNNAVIKNAVCGIRVGNTRLHNHGKGGGVIRANNTQFVNNQESVHFNAYSRVNINNIVIDNVSCFNNCTFSVDNNACFVVDTSNVQVSLYNVRGVKFNGCQFEDMQTKSDWQNLGTAIYACLSGFRINEQTDMFQYPANYYNTPCTFSNYKNAIAIVGSAEKPVKIYNTMFNDNSTGVNAKNADALSILSCSFSSGSESFRPDVHGLILDSCNLYRIENNQFTGIGNGIKIIGKTEDNNTIRLNTFDQLCRAIEVYGNNGQNLNNIIASSPELIGLQFECNNFITDSTDIYVDGQATIRLNQGWKNKACGNYFNGSSIKHFNNQNSNWFFYYYNNIVPKQIPYNNNQIYLAGTSPDVCGNRHGYIGDYYYNVAPMWISDYENTYNANYQLYVTALDNYLTTYNGLSIDWSNVTSLDDPNNPQLYDLLQLSELKKLLDETCKEAIHLLGNATEVGITDITTWLQRLSSLNADLLSIHYLSLSEDVSLVQSSWDQIIQHHSIVNPEDTSFYQYCINQLNVWAKDTSSDVNISQGAIDTLTAIANSNNTASPYAVSVLECINKHYPWWKLRVHTSCNWTIPIESMSPKKETDSERMNSISLQPNPTDGMMEIRSNNEKIKYIELFDIFGKRLMDNKVNDNTISLDLSHYAKGMYLLRYTLSDGTQRTKKIIKE